MNLDVGIPRHLAALAAGVTPATVSMWAQRGWFDQDNRHHTVTIVGVLRRGQRIHRLYRVGDILAAERDTRHSPNSRRPQRVIAAA